MDLMFAGAAAFNQNIGGWNTESVINMSSMFEGAAAFNQNLCDWPINANVAIEDMFLDSGCDKQQVPDQFGGAKCQSCGA